MYYYKPPITMTGWVETFEYKQYSFTCEMNAFLIYRLDEVNAYEEFAEEDIMLAEQGLNEWALGVDHGS